MSGRRFDEPDLRLYLARMRHALMLSTIVALVLIVGLNPAPAAPQLPDDQVSPGEGLDEAGPPIIPDHGTPPLPPKGNGTRSPADGKPATRAESLDALFARLAKATDADEATGIAGLIDHLWMESGSDTADLLMSRALAAMGQEQKDLALALLDRIVILRPDWAEAWNKRATLRFMAGDDAGSVEDISHTLSLEPRHFGALSGLGFILRRNGLDKAALKALRRAHEIYPESPDISKAVDELAPQVEGRDL